MRRPAVFHPAAKKMIREFPEGVRKELGEAIAKLQLGEMLSMPLSRPMPSVGAGVSELRVKDEAGEWRAFYVVKMAEAVYVFHAFGKKTQETLSREIKLGQKRLKEWEAYRDQEKKA
jgi:phage-related protein